MILVISVIMISGCTSVKPYQKMYLNDPDMQLKSRDIEAYEISCESYREGSTGAHGGKAGGGCGCF